MKTQTKNNNKALLVLNTQENFTRISVSAAIGAFSILTNNLPGPQIHFAHANGFNGQTYLPLLNELAKDHKVTAWDARGHGNTSVPADPDMLDSWLHFRDDLIQVLDFIGPSFLVGHSMGATTSLLAAAKRPDLVLGLVLIDPVVVPRTLRLLTNPMMIAARLLGRRIPNPLSRGAEKRRSSWLDTEAILEQYRGRGIFKSWQPGFLENYIEGGTYLKNDGQVGLSCAPDWEAAIFECVPFETWSEIRQVQCSITIVSGEHRSTCPESRAVQLLARSGSQRNGANTACSTVAGTSHFLPMENPSAVATIIKDAIATVHPATL